MTNKYTEGMKVGAGVILPTDPGDTLWECLACGFVYDPGCDPEGEGPSCIRCFLRDMEGMVDILRTDVQCTEANIQVMASRFAAYGVHLL